MMAHEKLESKLKLIQLIKEQPELWKSPKDRCNILVKKKLWGLLAKRLGVKSTELQRRYCIIRQAYRIELLRERDYLNGITTTPFKKSELYDSLSFLKEVIVHRSRANSELRNNSNIENENRNNKLPEASSKSILAAKSLRIDEMEGNNQEGQIIPMPKIQKRIIVDDPTVEINETLGSVNIDHQVNMNVCSYQEQKYYESLADFVTNYLLLKNQNDAHRLINSINAIIINHNGKHCG